MMDGRIVGYYTDGTSALKLDEWRVAKKGASIIAFPKAEDNTDENKSLSSFWQILASVKAKALSTLYASEMYCSLRFEDFRGCPYRMFSRQGIAVLSSAVAVLAIVSLIAGA